MEWVTLSIRLFVVISGPTGDLFKSLDMAQDLVSFEAVGIDNCTLGPRQTTGFIQNFVRHPELAQIVQ